MDSVLAGVDGDRIAAAAAADLLLSATGIGFFVAIDPSPPTNAVTGSSSRSINFDDEDAAAAAQAVVAALVPLGEKIPSN